MKQHQKKVAVIGLGRVGLPLSLVLAESGFEVIGIDKDSQKSQSILQKRLPFKEKGASALLLRHAGKNLKIGILQDLQKCKTVIVCVGTFLKDDKVPDLSDAFEVFEKLLPHLAEDTLIVLRSTVHPKGTDAIYSYIKNHYKKKFFLVYAPERIAEGFAVQELYKIPQIIGSYDKKSALLAEKIFETFVPEVLHTDPLSAELAKLVLNTYRYSNFALVNELTMIVDYFGRDIYSVLQLANKDYLRGGIPTPGLAAGPCLVKDSFFLKYNTPFNTLITGSYFINDNFVDFLIAKINKHIPLKGKKVALLGVSFKKNIDDERGSLSLKLIKLLKQAECTIQIHDPYLTNTKLNEVLETADIVILAVDHDEYKKFTKSKLKAMTKQKSYVCDIWNIIKTNKIFFSL